MRVLFCALGIALFACGAHAQTFFSAYDANGNLAIFLDNGGGHFCWVNPPLYQAYGYPYAPVEPFPVDEVEDYACTVPTPGGSWSDSCEADQMIYDGQIGTLEAYCNTGQYAPPPLYTPIYQWSYAAQYRLGELCSNEYGQLVCN